ncbi:MAG: 30S ribosomal protein S8 [Candidatus Collierbacteria bacterium GW2011_GWB1_45_35]|uniref:Small ribosomal subunit protein uS8 n=2 Tax=Candidatus Collieribacteriota TaxID=1752725 RepID=A0A0G1KPX6_9BACT|nr:MAG: 30S ribosomal protein S8 [Microgenomates group bacterium GW2011_GWC1_44_23]KKT85696.1 MAG: 30S ribosomal protein S8 [Candidatus Collierbacteria bacterium GW2011_GWA2_44_99]KKT96179.1 MAG: 30S ribosomal protein S8 [Candidatus Collierbacteria bacterium GW2011_GWA1_45_15]KKU01219.1 MAG: 30S ribosomal protein S8 [Candidatus Collierbacteria bacterium GW2011_GWB2_45_17]KKU05354.1 MAG: 30S ribosomal protein S8 [Candidatus Collierbacteria bacterium GW2011_GWB1_45_35]KKU08501.1 MAG: 30S ribosom
MLKHLNLPVTAPVITVVASSAADLVVSSVSSVFAVSASEKWLTEESYPVFSKCQNNMDTTADFLTIIRNGYLAKKDTVVVEFSKAREELTKILKTEAFIVDYSVEKAKPVNKLIINLRYFDKGLPAVTGIKKITKPSVRIYSGYNQIPRTLSGAGTTILTTSAGYMTGKTAREKHLGGEVICQIW